MDKVFTVADLRPIMQVMFPAVEDERDDNEKYEHPMTAVGLVLLSAAIISTTEATKLVLFTGYSRPFISAITFNMQNNQLWVGGRYDASTWLSLDGRSMPSAYGLTSRLPAGTNGCRQPTLTLQPTRAWFIGMNVSVLTGDQVIEGGSGVTDFLCGIR